MQNGFDRVTRTACKLFDVPHAAIAMIDRDRYSFRSVIGLSLESIPQRALPLAADATGRGFTSISDLANSGYAQGELAAAGLRFYAAAPLVTADGQSIGALCVFDRAPRVVSAAEAEGLTDLAAMLMVQVAMHPGIGRIDASSGLPNRAQFVADLEALARETPKQRRLAAMIDLASPEQLISSVRVMGTGYLDALVLDAARRFRNMIGPGQTAYHVTGTQFACLAPAGMTEEAYRDFVTIQLQEARALAKSRFVATTALGIAPFILGEDNPLDVLRMAHNAAQDARLTDSRVAIYSPAHDAVHRRRFAILAAFDYALDHPEELSLAYQPRIDLGSGACCGAEALLRWRSATLGGVSPAEFMPFVEQSAMIRPVTARVLEMAMRQLAAWRAVGLGLDLAVNVSAMNLLEQDFAERLAAGLAEHHLDPAALELEMTESALIGEANLVLSMLNTIAGSGVRLAIDDFGTGYSGLSYLQRLPAQTVKIDQSFIRGLANEAGNLAVVRATVALCHDLGYRVVAEGVETQEALDLVAEAGCDEAQGYFFGQPLPAEDFAAWFRAWTPDAGMGASA
ncbi:EAL domain-containing protein [Acidisoma sp.]|uniref:sensor domain-containing phosphodiesterase n=1 Tax=Acidisoma sp. TaxID=1872115 RepID=UPI003AFFC800